MRGPIACIALLLIVTQIPFAAPKTETWTGWLTVECCKDSTIKPPPQHPRECLINCASGEGGRNVLLTVKTGQFLTLDPKGKTMALDALKASTIERGTAATITGTLESGVIKVATLKLLSHESLSNKMKKEMAQAKISMEKAQKEQDAQDAAKKAAEKIKK
jgi:hypothetical protein